MKNLELSDEQAAALEQELTSIIAIDKHGSQHGAILPPAS
jgi:hypothetical protein